MELKTKLKNLMNSRGLNGQKLARLSQVSDSEISRILQGKSRPGLDNALRLAQALGVSLDYLADDGLDSEAPEPADSLSAEERKALGIIQKLGSPEVLTILENVRFLGYEVAMSRLVGAKPIIEIDKDVADSRAPLAARAGGLARAGLRVGVIRVAGSPSRPLRVPRRPVAAQNCLRWRLDGMLSAWRYLVTVLRATFKPWRPISSTISSSERGFCLSSLAMISSSFCLMVSQAISSPSAVVVPPPKNRLSGKMPRGVWTHLSSTARLTVVTCTPTRSAICCILSGSMNSGPLSRKTF